MVLLVEILLGLGILLGVYRLAVSDADRSPEVAPDRAPDDGAADAPLTAEALLAHRLPYGVGYRKDDVDRLLARVAHQLPRAGETQAAETPPAGRAAGPAVEHPVATRVPLEKSPVGEDRHG